MLYRPDAQYINKYAEVHGIGAVEARRRILRERVVDVLETESATLEDVKEVLLMIFKGDV